MKYYKMAADQGNQNALSAYKRLDKKSKGCLQ
jgi:hypothetical protein